MVFFRSKSKGVTLVELSIVLAIFGILIIVGISGRALIDISRTNATMQYLNHRSIAFQTFETTYDCLPGDCAKDLTQINVTAKGDGDTIIELNGATTGAATAANNELAFVEEHFVKAKLFNRTITPTIVALAQTTTDNKLSAILPIVKIPSTYVSTFTIASKNYNVLGALSSVDENIVNGTPVAYPNLFRIIDAKLDDGDAEKGIARCETTDITTSTTTLTGAAYSTTACVFAIEI